MNIGVGDTVMKATRKGHEHIGGKPLGVVISIEGSNARIRSGKSDVTSLWPVRLLRVCITARCVCHEASVCGEACDKGRHHDGCPHGEV